MHAYHAIGDLILRIFTCTYSVTREWVMECDEMSYGDYAIGAFTHDPLHIHGDINTPLTQCLWNIVIFVMPLAARMTLLSLMT